MDCDIYDLQRKIDKLEYDVDELKWDRDSLKNILYNAPYYLVGINGSEIFYLAVFNKEEDLKEFVSNCKLKGKNGFKKNSLLGLYETWDIKRDYVPTNLPKNPRCDDLK